MARLNFPSRSLVRRLQRALVLERRLCAFYKQRICELEAKNLKLRVRVLDLEARLSLNSSNSSMPPSSDRKPNSKLSSDSDAKPSSKSLRSKTGKRPGAQKGHKGYGFSLPKREPDQTISCVPTECEGCPHATECAKHQKKVDTRYVLDLIIKTLLLRYVAYSRQCPLRGGVELTATFPRGVNHTKQYGNLFWALAVALYVNFNCSYDKIHEFLSQLTDTKASVGWAFNKFKALAESVAANEAIERIKQLLLQERTVVCDETGVRAECGNAWIHNASTSLLTLQTVSRKRGSEGMLEGDFLPHYMGTVVHDCWSPYWNDRLKQFDNDGNLVSFFQHALCNQHLIRELRWVYEIGPLTAMGNQDWAFEVEVWLLTFQMIRNEAIAKGQRFLSNATVANYQEIFMDYVDEGMAKNPDTNATKDSKIHRKIRALLKRMAKRCHEFLKFLQDFDVPFTSNQAERDLRIYKARLAVSGCFRKLDGCARYVKLYSIVNSAHKLGVTWKDTMLGLIRNESVQTLLPYDGQKSSMLALT